MIEAVLTRQPSTNQGTEGILTASFEEMQLRIAILELPWRDNKPNISCIPPGSYMCEWERSNRFGMAYHIKDVDGRTHILFHQGNYAGDQSKGFRSDSRGCLLTGTDFSVFGDQSVIINSSLAKRRLEQFCNCKDFALEIIQLSDNPQGGTF